MSDTDLPAVVAARRGPDGAVLFLTEETTWTDRLERAEVIEDAAHGDLRLLEARWSAGGMERIALAPVELGGGGRGAAARLRQSACAVV